VQPEDVEDVFVAMTDVLLSQLIVIMLLSQPTGFAPGGGGIGVAGRVPELASAIVVSFF
jgi:hypothetical protein